MKALSFDGVTFASLDINARIVRGLLGPEAQAASLERVGTHPFNLGPIAGLRPVTIRCYPTDQQQAETRLLTLLGTLDPDNRAARVLQVQIDLDSNDVEETTVEADATIGDWHWADSDGKYIEATFHIADPVWRKTSDSSSTGNTISTSGASFVVTNAGKAPAHPVYKIGWSNQRTSESPDVGWKYRKTVVVTNDETRTEPRETKAIDLGDTAAIVTAGKALASGNDLRVRLAGRELPRTLANWNTKRTFCYVAVTIPAGQSVTLEIVYGNPDAGVPVTLAELGKARDHPERFSALDQNHVNGTATSGTSTVLTDTSKTLKVNRFRGGFLQIVAGTGSGQKRKILSNTATAFTVNRNWTTTPDSTSVYVVWMSGLYVNGGQASSATSTTLTDSSQSFGVNALIGGTITIDSGTGSGQSRAIKSNTPTQVTVATWDTTPDSTSVYSIERQGFHIYYVEQETKRSSTATDTLPQGDVWTGGWFQDARFTPAGTIMKAADGIANAWDTYLMLHNNDDYGNASAFQVDVGGGDLDNFTGLDADRRVGQDKTLNEEGIADGVILTNPHGYDGIFFDYQIKNPAGIAMFTFRVRGAGGGEWQSVLDDSQTQANLFAVAAAHKDLTGAELGSPLHLYMGALPADEVEIPSTASPGNTATMRWYRRLECYLNLANWSIGTLSAEESIYDLNARVKLAALGAVPPYDQIEFGGDGHHVHVPSGHKVWLRTDPDTTDPLIGLYNGDVLVAEIPYAGVVYRYIRDIRGNSVATVSDEFAPLPPGNTTITVIEEEIGTLSVDLVYRDGYLG